MAAEQVGDVDWVTATTNADLAKSFERLRETVAADVEKWQRLHPESTVKVDVADEGPLRFRVFGFDSRAGMRAVGFACEEGHVRVFHPKTEFTATPILDERCQLWWTIGSERLEEWQLRKRALQPVLFG